MATTAKDIGSKFGTSVEEFEKSSTNAVEDILVKFSNESIKIMRGSIAKQSRTGYASTLGQSMVVMPVKKTASQVNVAVKSEVEYWDYVNQGVRGVKKNRAPKSKYKFKNLGTPPQMIESFKDYIARTGSRSKGKSVIRKNKKKQADLITQAAKQLATATKISGIEPMKFVDAALTKARKDKLRKDLAGALGKSIRLSIR